MMKVLFVEDNEKLREILSNFLSTKGFEVEGVESLQQAREALKKHFFSAIITDLKLSDGEGMELIEEGKKLSIPVIMITAYGTIPLAVEAVKRGAYDFIQKPVDPDHLLLVLERALEEDRRRRSHLLLKEELQQKFAPEIVGRSPALKAALEKLRKAAAGDVTVLLLGESGTGKELFARALHALSHRSEGPFVAINCASIPESLLESELFGHEKGAFTGAHATKRGKFELASGGTLFLDEISEMSPALQAKLLRVIEEKRFERVGGTRTIEVDVRIVVATNRDLNKEVQEGRFREDLYYRISVFPIRIPPLRERKEDIPLLAEYFAERAAKDMKVEKPEISDAAMEKLLSYSWPGNVRELKNVIERAVILCEGGRILPHHIILIPPKQEELDLSGTLEEAVKRAAEWAEKIKIQRALEDTGGKLDEAARTLGISLKTLYAKMKKHGLK